MVNSAAGLSFEKEISREALDLHYSSFVADAHCDTLSRCTPRNIDFGRNLPAGHIDLRKLKSGGVNLQVFAAFVHPSQRYRGFFEPVNRMLDKLEGTAARYPDQLSLVRNADDLKRLRENGRIGAVAAIEGLHLIEGRVDNLRHFYRRGVRVVTLTWNNSNEYAVSSLDDAMRGVRGGLTDRGVDIIKEMNSLGITIDLSHCASDTLRDALRVSSTPPLVSHSCCRHISDIFRNLSDEEIRAVADARGVIGVNYYPMFLENEYQRMYFELWEERNAKYRKINTRFGYRSAEAKRRKKQLQSELEDKLPKVPYTRIVDHMEHIINTGGEDAVGLGSDFDGIPDTPLGFENVSKLPLLTQEMLRRGWSEKRIRKILGENMLRLFSSILK